jgi:hypothetical protein
MDEDDVPQYQWTAEQKAGEEEPVTAKFVKHAGRAKSVYPNGDVFEGVFNDNKAKHGPGTYTWSTAPGANPWVPEAEDEEGEGSWPADRVVAYTGDYVEGVKEGVGKITFPNGDKYHGQWKSNKIHGEGTYFYANGDIYSGQWENCKKHGEGAYVYKSDDSQLVGSWVNGSITSGKWVFKDGTSWHGSFKNQKPIGRGVFYLPNGNQQDGIWVEEGDPEDEETEPKLVWKAGSTVPSSVAASDVTRPAPVVA